MQRDELRCPRTVRLDDVDELVDVQLDVAGRGVADLDRRKRKLDVIRIQVPVVRRVVRSLARSTLQARNWNCRRRRPLVKSDGLINRGLVCDPDVERLADDVEGG